MGDMLPYMNKIQKNYLYKNWILGTWHLWMPGISIPTVEVGF